MDSRVHYVTVEYAVVDNPYEGFCPTLIKRHPGDPDEKEVTKILNLLGMLKFGEPYYRSDGLWCHKLKMNGASDGTSV